MTRQRRRYNWKNVRELWVKTGLETARGVLDASIKTLDDLAAKLSDEAQEEEKNKD